MATLAMVSSKTSATVATVPLEMESVTSATVGDGVGEIGDWR
jgi:hypothetical protein